MTKKLPSGVCCCLTMRPSRSFGGSSTGAVILVAVASMSSLILP